MVLIMDVSSLPKQILFLKLDTQKLSLLYLLSMSTSQQQFFLTQFFDYVQPKPLVTAFTEEEFRSNDMKISLEIATQSYLRMQSDPKTNLVSFSCKNYGKSCYEIFACKNGPFYVLQTDYTKFTHAKSCQLKQQAYQYLKIYNLMKLKKNLIQNYMITLNLINASPSEILASISQQNQYFFEKHISYNPELRRKLRKRFDNIINIDIKRITKGGWQQRDDGILTEFINCGQRHQKLKQWTFIQERKIKKELTSSVCQKQKNKPIKKEPKWLKKQSVKLQNKSKSKKKNVQKQNHFQDEKIFFNPSQKSNHCFESVEDLIYFPSESQLPEIKELNSDYNYFGDAFTIFEQDQQIVQMETINDQLRAS